MTCTELKKLLNLQEGFEITVRFQEDEYNIKQSILLEFSSQWGAYCFHHRIVLPGLFPSSGLQSDVDVFTAVAQYSLKVFWCCPDLKNVSYANWTYLQSFISTSSSVYSRQVFMPCLSLDCSLLQSANTGTTYPCLFLTIVINSFSLVPTTILKRDQF